MKAINKRTDMSHDFGNCIKFLRHKKNITQEVLSGKSGIGVDYISNIENGIANPTLKVVSALLEALDVSPSALFSGLNLDNE